jgi:hydrogenase expression/formation protein HypC
MCIGIPMRVIESNGLTALCEASGVQRRVNVMLIEGAEPGAWVLTHAGNAVRLLADEEAAQINEALDALTAALDGEPVGGAFASPDRN